MNKNQLVFINTELIFVVSQMKKYFFTARVILFNGILS